MSRHGEQLFTTESHRTERRLIDAAHDVEHRGLAGAVRPDETADVALIDAERQPIERDDASETHRHVFYVEQRHADLSPPPDEVRSP